MVFTGLYSAGGASASGLDFADYLLGLPNLETTIDTRGAGMSISYKRSR